jgi:hypothetical protein
MSILIKNNGYPRSDEPTLIKSCKNFPAWYKNIKKPVEIVVRDDK